MQAVQGSCKKNSGSFKIAKLNYAKGCIGIQIALRTAPIAVRVSGLEMRAYSSGIFNNCRPSPLNHGVLLVGIVSGNWLIKNSWSVNHG